MRLISAHRDSNRGRSALPRSRADCPLLSVTLVTLRRAWTHPLRQQIDHRRMQRPPGLQAKKQP